MSFVGPRPCLSIQKDLLKIRQLNKVCFLKAGLTGLAQINSFDGMSIENKSFYDEIYLNKISFTLDFLIILRTFLYLFKVPPKY